MFRLDSNFPALATAFRSAPAARRRAAALVATEMALARAGINDGDVRTALEGLRRGVAVDAGLRARVEALATKLDESYFDAEEAGDGSRSLGLFSKARAAAALVCALSEDPSTLHEAVYEATVAVEDPSDIVAAVSTLLA